MGKVTKVEIPEGSGNYYRYEYDDESQSTRYLGPVGEAPALDEQHFMAAMTRKYPTVMDLEKAKVLAERLRGEIDVPWVHTEVSTLGGVERPSVMLKLSLDPKEEWYNGIYHNSRYMMFRLGHDGELEQFSRSYKIQPKFRKRHLKNPHDAVEKINHYLDRVRANE